MMDICERLNEALKDRETGKWLLSGHCTYATSDLVAEARDEIRRLRTALAAEREACATVAEAYGDSIDPAKVGSEIHERAAARIAAAIRSRGATK